MRIATVSKSVKGSVPPSDNPYQSPAPVARRGGPGDIGAGGGGFKPIRWASTAAMVGLSLCVGMAAISVYLTLDTSWVSLVSNGGDSVAPIQSAGADRRAEVFNAIERIATILTSIFFLVWFHRSYRNLAWLGVEGTKYSTRWAVGGWFIPIMNLVRPYQVAREIWDASNPDVTAAEGPRGWLQKRSAFLIRTWWVLGLAPTPIIFIAQSFTSQPSREKWKIGVWLFIVGNLINGVSAAATMLVIRRLDARQAARHGHVRSIFASQPLAHLAPEEKEGLTRAPTTKR